MTEWQVFGVIVALVSFGLLVGKPILSLANTLTQLRSSIDNLNKLITEYKTRLDDVTDKVGQHDVCIARIDTRVSTLEKERGREK